MTDTRVEKLIVAIGGNLEHQVWRQIYTNQVAAFEDAGLLVIDPTDEATIERAARALTTTMWGSACLPSNHKDIRVARAVLAALSLPRDGGNQQ